MKIISAESTVFFTHDRDRPQRVDVVIENSGQATRAVLKVTGGGQEQTIPLASVPSGASTHPIFVPELKEQTPFRFLLENGEEFTVDLDPQRRWEVSFIHMSHHDWGYTGIPRDVVAEHIGFMDNVLNWCEETASWPEESKFRYLCEQAWSVIPWIENRSEADIQRLVKYIKCGQVEVAALWGNQTTELCSAEELARLMYPAFRLKREHGIDVVSAVHNDIPGFAWGLTSILADAGVKYFSFGVPRWYFTGVHPCWDEDRFISFETPNPFLWEGPNGARLFSFYMFHGARSIPEPWVAAEGDMDKELKDLAKKGYGYEQIAHMVTGGYRDNAPPTIYLAELAKAWNAKWAYPVLKTATNQQFMAGFEERYGLSDLPVVRGELPNTDYTVSATCTPKETGVNRNTHETLVTAEKLATVAAELADYDYPSTVLEEAYRNTFNFDLHCWGMYQSGGPAMDASWDEKRGAATRAAALSHDVVIKAANRICDKIAYPDDSFYLTVFNPLGTDRDCTVRVSAASWCPSTMPMTQARRSGIHYGASAIGRNEIQLDEQFVKQDFDLVDVDTGENVRYQLSRLTDATDPRPWAAERVAIGKISPRSSCEFVFMARALPAMGYRTYRVVPVGTERPAAADTSMDPCNVENDFFTLAIDAATGSITSLFDKEFDKELVDANAPHGFGDLIVRSCATAEEQAGEVTEAGIVEHGDLFTTIRVKGASFAVPHWTRDIIVYHCEKRIDVNFRLLRDSEPNVEVYAAFPFLVENPTFVFEGSGSVIEPTVDQVPGSNTDYYAMQRWADVSGKNYGISWSPVDTHMVEFGGLWPGYVSAAHHGVTGPGYGHPFLKPGEISKGHIYAMIMYSNYKTNFINVQPSDILCRYAFRSHRGGWAEGDAVGFGCGVMNPPLGVWMHGPRRGELPPVRSFCSVAPSNVLLQNIKQADDGDGLVVRLAEIEGRQTEARLDVPFARFGRAVAASAVEEDREALICSNGTVSVPVGPFEIKTVRLRR